MLCAHTRFNELHVRLSHNVNIITLAWGLHVLILENRKHSEQRAERMRQREKARQQVVAHTIFIGRTNTLSHTV